MKQRIDYIDFVKGFAILWIIWFHTTSPDVIKNYYHVPIFFFISGIFFKSYNFKSFMKKETFSIIIPTLFFYILGYPFKILITLWDERTLKGFDWLCIFDVFSYDSDGQISVLLNVPIWFLFVLFYIRFFYNYLNRLPFRIKLICAILCLLFKSFWLSLDFPFMINSSLYWLGIFIIGNLYGSHLINFLSCLKRKIIVLLIAIFIYICSIIIPVYNDFVINAIYQFELISFIVITISFFSLFENLKIFSFLKFYGKNSLVVVGTHGFILTLFKRLSYKVFRVNTPFLGFLQSVLTALMLILVIKILNQYFPLLVGKKNKKIL